MHEGLKEDQALIVFASPRETSEGEASVLGRLLLTEEEQVRRFVDAEHRHAYIVARSLLRLGLSDCFPVEPAAWRFERDERQKPLVVSPINLPSFQFSLSHTRGLVALLVTYARHAGADVEYLQRTNDLPLVAQRICAPNELSSLEKLTGEEWKERFFQLWTLKEAYSKAVGRGLALPFDKVGFEIDVRGVVRAQFAAELHDDESAWEFSVRKIGADHTMSVALTKSVAQIDMRKVRVGVAGDVPQLEFV